MEKKNRTLMALGVGTAIALLMLLSVFRSFGLKGKRLYDERTQMRREIILLVNQAGMRSRQALIDKQNQLRFFKNQAEELRQKYDWHVVEKLPHPPPSKSEFYFSLSEFSNELIGKAEICNVFLPDGPKFGFSDIIRRGQVAKISIEKTWNQLQEIRILIPILFECSKGDLRFISLTRGATDSRDISGNPVDMFDIKKMSAIPFIEDGSSDIFCLKFRCHSDTFHRFLVEISRRFLPITLRSISVVGTNFQSGENVAEGEEKYRTIIKAEPSEYTIFLEWAHLKIE
jgi:hypothetical protein